LVVACCCLLLLLFVVVLCLLFVVVVCAAAVVVVCSGVVGVCDIEGQGKATPRVPASCKPILPWRVGVAVTGTCQQDDVRDC